MDAATTVAATMDAAMVMAIDPDMATGRVTDTAGRVTDTGIGLYTGADTAELPEAAITVVTQVAGIMATSPEGSMAVAAFTVEAVDSTVAEVDFTAVEAAMAAVATDN
jgi:hypothetical protein